LQGGDLMAEDNDLSLLSSTGPKRRSDQSQKGDEKWTHRGNDDGSHERSENLHFQFGRVFGIHNSVISCPVPHPYLGVLLFAVAAIASWRGELRVWTQWSQ
jgi:hypothetical protein